MLSSSQAASGAHAAAQQHMGLHQLVDNRRHSSVELEVLCKLHALVRAQADSGVPEVAGDVPQGTAVLPADCFGSAMAAEGQTMVQRMAGEAKHPRHCVVRSRARGTAGVGILQYVLGAERENEALTWEGMDMLAVQTC